MTPEQLRREIRRLRQANLETRQETRPRVWKKHDRMIEGPGLVYYAVLDTGGCRWAKKAGGCSMCGYIYDTCVREVRGDEVLAQARSLFGSIDASGRPFALRLFTSGSFFDTREIAEDARSQIVQMLGQLTGLSEVTFETRPEFVSQEAVSSVVDRLKGIVVEIAIGLESSSDKVRETCIGKGFRFRDYLRAARDIRSAGARVKTYVLVKPPFLSEFDSYFDAVETTRQIVDRTDTISYNACNVQRGTLVEKLYREGKYRPAWIWTVIQVLKKAHEIVGGDRLLICDTLAYGTPRGPHNCGRCDRNLVRRIEEFTLTQNPDALFEIDCPCRATWAKIYNYHF